MPHVLVEDLYTGQILAHAVFDAKGNELCAAGQIVCEADRARLLNAGVQEVEIQIGLFREADLRARASAIEARYKDINDPVMLMLKRVVLERLNQMMV